MFGKNCKIRLVSFKFVSILLCMVAFQAKSWDKVYASGDCLPNTDPNSSWTSDTTAIIGQSGNGTLGIEGSFGSDNQPGSLTNGQTYIGMLQGASGNVWVSGPGAYWNSLYGITVGVGGTGDVGVYGGILESGALMLGNDPNSIGNFESYDNSVVNVSKVNHEPLGWTSGDFTVGFDGQGAAVLHYTDMNVQGDVYVAVGAGSYGELEVTESSSFSCDGSVVVGAPEAEGRVFVGLASVLTGQDLAVAPNGWFDTWDATTVDILRDVSIGGSSDCGHLSVAHGSSLNVGGAVKVGTDTGSGNLDVGWDSALLTKSFTLDQYGQMYVSNGSVVNVEDSFEMLYGSQASLFPIDPSSNVNVGGDLQGSGDFMVVYNPIASPGIYEPVVVDGSLSESVLFTGFGGTCSVSGNYVQFDVQGLATSVLDVPIEFNTNDTQSFAVQDGDPNALIIAFKEDTGDVNLTVSPVLESSAEQLTPHLGFAELYQTGYSFTGLNDDIWAWFHMAQPILPRTTTFTLWGYDNSLGWSRLEDQPMSISGNYVGYRLNEDGEYAVSRVIKVPKITGLTEDEAVDLLLSQGFTANPNYYEHYLPAGTVESQYDLPGSSKTQGSPVGFGVSTGPDCEHIPQWDLDGDCLVNLTDFSIIGNAWLNQQNGYDVEDLKSFADEWLYCGYENQSWCP